MDIKRKPIVEDRLAENMRADKATLVLQKYFLGPTSRLDVIRLLTKPIMQDILRARQLPVQGTSDECSRRIFDSNTSNAYLHDFLSTELSSDELSDIVEDDNESISSMPSPKMERLSEEAQIPANRSMKIDEFTPVDNQGIAIASSKIITKADDEVKLIDEQLKRTMNELIGEIQRQLSSAPQRSRPSMEGVADGLARLPPLCVKLLEAKRRTNLSFVDIAKRMNRNEVWVASVFYGQAKPSFDDIKRLRNIFSPEGEMSLHDITERELNTYFPERGLLADALPADPTLYRLGEVLKVYGHPIKAIMNEKFGDGIISAVDCTVFVDKVQDAGGDRVKLTINGKFLSYKPW